MGRRMVVAACLALGLLATAGSALADPTWQVPDVPGRWGEQARGDVCEERGDPPCHTTTHATTTTGLAGTSTKVTTTTTDVAGTSATSATTTTGVVGTSATATTTTAAGTTTAAAGTTTTAAVLATTASTDSSPTPHVRPSAGQALAHTGAAPLWTGVGGLALLLSGAGLLLLNRRRRG